MDGSSNNSFIPKRGPANKPKRVFTQKVYLFTVFSYVIFSATLVSAVSVFFYSRYIDSQFQSEVAVLSDEIARFNDADMNKVLVFDERLHKALSRLEVNVSLGSLFSAIETAAARTVQIESLNLDRKQDETFELAVSMKTNNFDSSIFQREMYEQNNTINTVEISELVIRPKGQDEVESVNLALSSEVTFTAKLGVPVSAIPFIPPTSAQEIIPANEVNTQVQLGEVSTTTSSSTTVTGDNEISL